MEFIDKQDKMAIAKSAALRCSIIEGRQAGKTLQQLALEYQVCYATVQSLCSRYAIHGEKALKNGYGNCGKNRPSRQNFLYRAATCYKTWHPSWGAEKIRTEIQRRRPGVNLPPARTLQKWFHYAGLKKSRQAPPVEVRRWATRAHEVWQVDAKEEIRTLDGVKNCWLNLKDEYTGAVIDPVVFSPQKNL